MVRFSASGIHQQNNYELKAEKRLGPQAAQTKGVSITRTKLDESSNPRKKGFTRRKRSYLVYFIQSQSELSQNDTHKKNAVDKQKSPP